MKWGDGFTKFVSIIFGCMLLIMATIVSIEIVSRKIFMVSLQGADEISGYIMAVISCLAAAVAVVGRNHIRIDIFYSKFSVYNRSLLNMLSSISITLLSSFMAYSALPVLADSIEYNSTAPTPLSTPLLYPMTPWFIALTIFACVSAIYSLRAIYLFSKKEYGMIEHEFNPKSHKEELDEEIKDVQKRASA